MIRVIGDRVMVALPPEEDEEKVSEGGIVLVRDPDRVKTPTRGIVVQLGEKSEALSKEDVLEMFDSLVFDAVVSGGYDRDSQSPRRICDHSELVANLSLLAPAPFDVQVGDCVLFPLSAGEQFSQDGVDYVVLHESEIIGVVEKETVAA